MLTTKSISQLETISVDDIQVGSDTIPVVHQSAGVGQTFKSTLIDIWNALKAAFQDMQGTDLDIDDDRIVISVNSDGSTKGISPTQLANAIGAAPDKIYCGGVIRPVAGVWNFISDDNHTFFPSNATVSQDNANNFSVRVTYGFTAKKVISFIAVVDDSLAKGWECGSSVGKDYADILIYKNIVIGSLIYYDTGTSTFKYSGATEECSFAYNSTTGELTITHPNVNTGAAATMPLASATNEVYRPIITAVTDTTVVIKFVKQDGTIKTGAADANMKIYFQRNGGWILLKPDSALFPTAGNIWFYGVFEK